MSNTETTDDAPRTWADMEERQTAHLRKLLKTRHTDRRFSTRFSIKCCLHNIRGCRRIIAMEEEDAN